MYPVSMWTHCSHCNARLHDVRTHSWFCRRGELMDRSLLSSVCRMLVALGLYPQFEMAFMEHSELFYQAEGSRRAVDDEARAHQRASGFRC